MEQNPADIAREAFRRLATRRIAPTPEAYRDIYNEIAGIPVPPAPPVLAGTAAPADPGPELMLYQFASRLGEQPGDLAEFGRRWPNAPPPSSAASTWPTFRTASTPRPCAKC
jgi:diguanylate cyclase